MPWKVSHIINVACNVSSSEEKEEDDMEETVDDAEEEHDNGHSLLLFKADVPAPLVCNYI